MLNLMPNLPLVLVLWVVVLTAVAIDLISGVRKARCANITRTSYGFRRTVSKLIQYYSMMVFALLFDTIGSMVVNQPYFTMLASAFLVFIEARSVYEKSGDKMRGTAAANLADLITLLENRDDLLKGFTEILRQKNKAPSGGAD